MVYLNTGSSRASRLKIREQMLFKLCQQACAKAERIKGEPLSKGEVTTVFEKLRAELERRDFFCMDGSFDPPKMPITEYLKSKGVVEEKHDEEGEG